MDLCGFLESAHQAEARRSGAGAPVPTIAAPDFPEPLSDAAARVQVFNDLSPGIVMVNEGTLAQLAEAPTSRP